jgi:hypothetical protein
MFEKRGKDARKMFRMRKGLSTRRLVTLLQASLGPVSPREEFVKGLRERLANLPAMPVLVERPRHWVQSAALAGVGLVGVLASAAAVAAMGVRFAGRILALDRRRSTVPSQSKGAKAA